MAARKSRCKREQGGEPAPLSPLTWRAAEALGHAHYLNRGGRVLVSPYDGSRYDFVVEKEDGSFFRVNVKVATIKRGRPGSSWSAYTISRARAGSANPDRYLVWLTKHNQFIELSGDFLSVQKHRSIPQTLVAQLTQGATP